MIMAWIILGILAVMLIYQTIKWGVIYNFRQKNKALSAKELEKLAQDLYWDLDDFGWDWRKAIEYQTAVEMLKEKCD